MTRVVQWAVEFTYRVHRKVKQWRHDASSTVGRRIYLQSAQKGKTVTYDASSTVGHRIYLQSEQKGKTVAL